MSLKFPFKFKHVLSGDEYLADQDINNTDKIVVSWLDGTQHPQSYMLGDAEHYIKNNNWAIIEEPSPIVEISQEDYDNLIEEINLLQDLLAEANTRITELEGKSKFKPVKNMTFEDWKEAKAQGYKFTTRCGHTVGVLELEGHSIWGRYLLKMAGTD